MRKFKRLHILGSTFFHEMYRAEKKAENTPPSDILSKKEYKKMEALMAAFISNKIVEDQGVFTFPETLGQLMFRTAPYRLVFFGRPLKSLNTDFVKGRRKMIFNAATFGRRFVPFWWKDGRYVRNKTMYDFRVIPPILQRFKDLIKRADKDPTLVIISK